VRLTSLGKINAHARAASSFNPHTSQLPSRWPNPHLPTTPTRPSSKSSLTARMSPLPSPPPLLSNTPQSPGLHRLQHPVRRIRQPLPHDPPLCPPLRRIHLRHRRVVPANRPPMAHTRSIRSLMAVPHGRCRKRGLQSVPPTIPYRSRHPRAYRSPNR